MKATLLLTSLLLSISAIAAKVETKLSIKVSYTNKKGRTSAMAPVRYFTRYDNSVSVRNIKKATDCEAEAGKDDLISFYEPVDTFSCVTDGSNFIAVSYEAMREILTRSWTHSILRKDTVLDTIYDIESNSITTISETEESMLMKLIFKALASGEVFMINLNKESQFVYVAPNGVERFEVKITPKKTRLLAQ